MKKKVLLTALVALTLVFSIGLAACGLLESATDSDKNSPTTQEPQPEQEQNNTDIDGTTVYISAYDIAVRHGFFGTEEEWLESLKGKDGKDGKDGENATTAFSINDVYEAALQNGYEGTFLDFVQEYLSDAVEEVANVSAYDVAVRNGFSGTEEEWLASLKGENGKDGKNGENGKDGAAMFSVDDVYEAAVANGYEGTYLEFVREYIGDTATTSDVVLATNHGLRSAVIVIASFPVTQTDYWTGKTTETTTASGGAGVIYQLDKETGDAYVLTNFHIVYEASSTTENKFSNDIKLYLYGSEYADWVIPATFVGGSAYYDVAVLKVTGSEVLKNSAAVACTLAEGEVVVGQTAIAVGYPAAEGISATCGIVSVDSEFISLNIEGSNVYQTREFRLDTAINSGNSGGGVYNAEGKLIGIVNARHNEYYSESIENIGYAIPLAIVQGVADNVIDTCNGADQVGVHKCMLGVTTAIDDTKMVYDKDTGITSVVQNVIVTSIVEGGLADGVLQINDVITGVTIGEKSIAVTRSFHVTEFLLNARVGDVVTLNVTRSDEEGNQEHLAFDFTMTEESVTIFYTK